MTTATAAAPATDGLIALQAEMVAILDRLSAAATLSRWSTESSSC